MVEETPRVRESRSRTPDAMSTAIVVGGGPKGLAAAARLARAGCDVTVLEASDTVGGGARSSEYLASGLVHDHCSAAHPMALASPFFQELNLPGLEWCAPEIDCAHPLDDGSAGAFATSFDVTDELLGADAQRWRQVFAPVAKKFDPFRRDFSTGPSRAETSAHAGQFGVRVLPPATLLARTFKTEQARALWGGVAAHAFWRLDRPLTSAVGVTLTAAAHAHGWVVAKGGTQRIADALVADIVAHGGKIETNTRVSSVNDLPSHDVLMLDVVPSIALEILGDRLPSRIARAYRSFSHGPGHSKLISRSRVAFRGRLKMHDERAQFMLVGRLMKLRRMNARSLMARCQPHRLYWLVSSTWQTRAGLPETFTRSGRTLTCPTATQATRPRQLSSRSNALLPASETVLLAWRFARRQRCRSTTRTMSAATSSEGRIAVTNRLPTTREPEPVCDRYSWRVLVFIIDTAWCRCSRNVWSKCC